MSLCNRISVGKGKLKMKAVTKMIANREKNIIQFLMKTGQTRVGTIANHLGLSEKTVSNSLKEIDLFLKDFDMTVVRKPKIGVYIEGDNNAFAEVNRFLDNQVSQIPSTKEERVIYIFSKLLKRMTISRFINLPTNFI